MLLQIAASVDFLLQTALIEKFITTSMVESRRMKARNSSVEKQSFAPRELQLLGYIITHKLFAHMRHPHSSHHFADEVLITRECWLSLAWRLVPYALNAWERSWGAETLAAMLELPHYALELLVVLPLVQVRIQCDEGPEIGLRKTW